MRSIPRASLTLAVAASACAAGAGCHGASAPTPAAAPTLLISGATVIDGIGSPPRRANVRIAGDRIVGVGALTARADETVVHVGGGLALAPGFIDTHSHHNVGNRANAMGVLSQGITTVVTGQDGSGSSSVTQSVAQGAAVNVAFYAGHGTIRSRVLGQDFRRRATPDEVARMQALLRAEMDSGALGLSSGLEYDPGIYSDRAEVLALAKVAGDAGGRYISHIRSEDRYFWDAVDEIIQIGRVNRMPVQISHMKLGMIGLWGLGDSLLAVLNRARANGVNVTADVYPYRHWQSGLSVLFPARDFSDRAAAQFALEQVSPADSITLQSGPNRGKTIGQIARERGTDPATALMSLLADGGGGGIIAAGMSEPDIEKLIAWPHTNISSDGSLTGGHPRGWGSFPRVFSVYVSGRRVISTTEAVRKMTSLAAEHVGLKNRGRIAVGAYADLVLFDTLVVADRATFEQPQAMSHGIVMVWVNGKLAFDKRAPTDAMAGRLIRRGDP